ncbi:ABC transporter ATP-binding protein [Phytohabitans sp. ZYX-F-186]|uniref:ABC transporter ATP-binding protein n=1 Tax=Phytohabitans maris TaxID=3071409 RepID=A0ABU0ZLX2_9ACTN|nr:ABC transporter ATP-binding protein [Phytohabitans sp. ZYX-F-186]MDQ7907397.1 ABC transporter ATP-binding protein [Phytohabitans sp. ZYX-F-186]
MTALEIQNLDVSFRLPDREAPIDVLKGVSLRVEEGEIVAVVGESGSGKTTLIRAVTGSLADNATFSADVFALGDLDLRSLSRAAYARVRGARIGFVPQDPLQGLNPVVPVGRLAEEPLRKQGVGRAQRRRQVLELFERVGLDDPERVHRSFAHELSGGMCQRVLIAAAISTRPRLLIADEPTSALDVTIQKRILDLLVELRGEIRCSIVLVTHDLGVAEERADKLHVISRGSVVESGSPAQILASPTNDYTKLLLSASTIGTAVQVAEPPGDQDTSTPAAVHVRADGVSKRFAADAQALSDVSFAVRRGSTLGIVGESGSGKTTLLRIVAGLVDGYDGTVSVDAGGQLADIRDKASHGYLRRRTQLIYQGSYGALNPRLSVEKVIEEPLTGFRLGDRGWRRDRITELLDLVKLPQETRHKYSSELSGGQRQRVAIARALAAEPELLLADEPVSALDVTVQAQILELFRELRSRFNLTLLFVSHDLGVISEVADETLVLLRGEVVDSGPTARVLRESGSPYVRELVDAIPGGQLATVSS